MIEVKARLDELQSRNGLSGLSVAERNEYRDCEITLGMTTAGTKERAEAARRVEQFKADREAVQITCACRQEGGCHCHEYHPTERCECSFCHGETP